ncbi:MAG: response regulator [Pleurocapsa sp. SU_5_0]|nr:response regulator [Pleurocapsa sp. SU_5_0]
MIRVLLVDDQKMVRETLKISLETETDIEIVGTANNGIAAIQQVEILHPDIVIMNMEMPGLDGASATKQITSRFAQTKVLMHTSSDNDEYITKSLAMGAKGYLLKNVETQDLAGVIRNVNKGYTQISPGLLDKLLISTDSGVVISKLENSLATYQSDNSTTILSTATSQKLLSHLKLTTRQQQDEISKLRQSVNSNQAEFPKIKQYLGLIFLLWLISLPLLGFFLWRLDRKTNNLQVKTNNLQVKTNNLQKNLQSTVIPLSRVGLYGEFSLNGLAQRVTKAYKQDSNLDRVSSVYVAQKDDAIILFGTIADAALLRRMENIAKQVDGVKEVDTNNVTIEPDLRSNILNSAK